ncbi:diaminopimelate decarboxylase family protein [Salinarimonas chemoclinalis]|uniref:diaminopimelate decarboxylase family protein n=1 Tax=Salinarimonas chemoclinalis TaxID=3241599 RepID=UPI0035577D93
MEPTPIPDAVRALCNELDRPFYLYDRTRIEENIRRFRSISYPHTKIHFASMANDNPVLLGMLRDNGFGLFVNSLKHLALADAAGIDDVIFASTGVPEHVMRRLVQRGVWVNLDSVDQVALFGRLSPGGRAGLRLNIDEKSKNNVFIGAESRIGVMESEIDAAFDAARAAGVTLTGPHVYLGTDVTDIADLVAGVDRTIALSDAFAELAFVDLGGGFPLEAERFDFAAYDAALNERMTCLAERRGRAVQLVLEPGRAMFGDAARFYVQVTDVKERPDRWIVCTNASASLIPRAMFYEDYNPVAPAFPDGEAPFDKPVDIVGATTYSRDFMARGVTLPRVRIGDWLRFDHAGSYCYSMITRFLGQDMPPEYLRAPDGTPVLIREGERFLEEAV